MAQMVCMWHRGSVHGADMGSPGIACMVCTWHWWARWFALYVALVCTQLRWFVGSTGNLVLELAWDVRTWYWHWNFECRTGGLYMTLTRESSRLHWNGSSCATDMLKYFSSSKTNISSKCHISWVERSSPSHRLIKPVSCVLSCIHSTPGWDASPSQNYSFLPAKWEEHNTLPSSGIETTTLCSWVQHPNHSTMRLHISYIIIMIILIVAQGRQFCGEGASWLHRSPPHPTPVLI